MISLDTINEFFGVFAEIEVDFNDSKETFESCLYFASFIQDQFCLLPSTNYEDFRIEYVKALRDFDKSFDSFRSSFIPSVEFFFIEDPINTIQKIKYCIGKLQFTKHAIEFSINAEGVHKNVVEELEMILDTCSAFVTELLLFVPEFDLSKINLTSSIKIETTPDFHPKKKFGLKNRYELLKKLGFERELMLSVNSASDRAEILSKILNIEKTNAGKLINGNYPHGEVDIFKVESLLK